jgi:Maltokinase N-terminal cap domain
VALVYRAELHPTKLELLGSWLPTRPWYRGSAAAELELVASYRFDDPAGAVGIETLLVRAGDGPLLQAPLTYRAAPLPGADAWSLGTAEHSVLGRRWIYDGCGDPVYARALANAILTGAGEAAVFIDIDGHLERREPGMSVRGSGAPGADVPAITALARVDDTDPTVILTESVELTVARVLDDRDGRPPVVDLSGPPVLTGTWRDRPGPLPLARARTR